MQVKESQLYTPSGHKYKMCTFAYICGRGSIMKGENPFSYIAALFGNTSKLI
jgi:hypothetical protein